MDASHYSFGIILPAFLSFYWKPLTLSFAICALRGKYQEMKQSVEKYANMLIQDDDEH